MTKKIDDILQRGKTLMGQKTNLNNIWQDIAMNFYPQRAYFTVINGANPTYDLNFNQNVYAENLTTSYPIYVARELTNALATYLRPAGQEWFKPSLRNRKIDKNISNEAKKYLEFIGETMRWYMEDEATGFNVSMNQSDADIVNFGNSCISIEIDFNRPAPIPVFRCWMLRDLAWGEGYNGEVNFVVRRWQTKIRNAYQKFGDKLSPETLLQQKQSPDSEITIYHMVMTREDYENNYNGEKGKIKLPFVSVYCEDGTGHEIECVGSPTMIYAINRWERVSGSQYAQSPAIMGSIADARMIQSIQLAILEAAEKAINPPILAKADSIRSDIGLMANTISYVKEDLPGSIDDAVKVMNLDRSGLSFGLAVKESTELMLRKAFFLDKITLPVFDSRMTATEVRERVAEYIRNAAPLFNSMITQVNQPICKMIFRLLESAGAFGPPEYIPEDLRGGDGYLRKDIDFTFASPLLEADGRAKVQKFIEMQGLLANSASLDPNSMLIPDITIALRDALDGAGVPAKWLRDEDVVLDMIDQQQQAQQAQQFIQTLAAGGQAAQEVGKGAQAIQDAGIE